MREAASVVTVVRACLRAWWPLLLVAVPRPWDDVTAFGSALAGVSVEHEGRGPWRDVVIAAAGPLAAAACGALVLLAVRVLGLPGVAALAALPFLVHVMALLPPNRDGVTVLRALRAGTRPAAAPADAVVPGAHGGAA